MTWNRRELLAAAAGAGFVRKAGAAPASTVALARCPAYGAGVLPVLRKMFDQLGGIGKLVSGKTVAVKINMANPLRERTGFRPAWFTRWSHPDVIGAAVSLFGQAGASRIRIVEGSSEDAHPLEENFLIGGWDPNTLLKAAPKVEMENTSGLGLGREYKRVNVPGGLVYPGFDLNHSYTECDVLVSLAKLKKHEVAGVSLSMKNMIGITPVTIYGEGAGFAEPSEEPFGARTMFHTGKRQPSETAPAEKDPNSPREPGYRIPRIIVDIVRARPIHLAIIDGVESGLLIAGMNPVSTDAVGAACMGLDPMTIAALRLAEEAGLGTRDFSKIEIAGLPLAKARVPVR